MVGVQTCFATFPVTQAALEYQFQLRDAVTKL